MATPLLRTKLYIPPPRPDLVPRPHLIQHLDTGLYRRLTLISAPAGFGKTTLVSEWAARSNRLLRVAWISLDEDDNDPARFVAYVVAALQTIEAKIGEEASKALQSPQHPPLQEILIALVNQIGGISPAAGSPDFPFILVLDDYHLITAQAIHAAVSFLLDHLPPQMHLVIVARSDPPLALARLRGRGQLTELRLNDLRFTPSEANQLLHHVTGLELASDDIATLSSRTEGWIAGLQMAALALQSQRRPEATSTDPEWDARRATTFIRSFAGSDRYILDYLAEEVLQHQPDSVQDFLLQTAILDRLTAPLCDAVCFGEPNTDTGRTDGRSTLEMLERTNLFIIPLDNERRWYRYHRLFVDLLRSRLHETQPDLVPILHRRASQWYEHRALFHGEDGLMAAAISHALSAEDFERAADLTEQIAEATLMRSEVTTLLRWVDMLPEEMVRARSSLCLYHAWALLLSGRPVAELESRLEDIDEAADLSPGAVVPFRAWIAVFQGQLCRATELARQALEQLPQDDLFLRNIAAWILGASLASEDLASGSQALAEVARMSQVTGNLMVAVAALSQSAEQHMRQGQLHRAKAIYEQALALAVDDQGHQLPAAGAALMGLGELAREWNDLEAARRYLLEGIDLSEKWSEVGAFDGYITLAHVRQATGNLEGARDALEKAQQIAVQFDATELDDLAVAMYQARLWIWQGDVAAAMRWAEERRLEAEINVLQLEENRDSLAHRLRKYELVVLARLWLAQGRFDDALALLEQLLPLMEKRGRNWTAIEIRILKALALEAKGELDRALSVLEHALSSAEPEGYVRVFVDEGPSMAQLLYSTAARGIAPEYVGKILAAFDLEATADGRESTLPPSALIEPLSKRELEVLQLIAEGLSNREIARQLVISLSTVKGHTANIYGKLAVKSRVQAVTRARTLGILPSL